MEMESLPDEMQTQVMLRLPLKSLLRCIYVCKRWKSIICAEYFKTRYLERSLRMLSMTRDMVPAPNSLFDSICRDFRERYTVSAPIRGWICVQSAFTLMLYNPITIERLLLPVIVGRRLRLPNWCFFGYDEANGVFKVLGLFISRFEVYTVKSGGKGSWRPIACEHPHTYAPPYRYIDQNLPTPLSVTNALCKGGVLYYAAIRSLPEYHHTTRTITIMSFDLNSEKFTVNQLPEGFIVDYGSTMVNYNGKVALVNNSAAELQNTGGFRICVRNEDSGQWELERVVIPDWEKIISPHVLSSFVGTIGSGELVFTVPASSPAQWVLYYKTGSSELSGTVKLEGAKIGAYHYVRACLNHFECLFRTT